MLLDVHATRQLCSYVYMTHIVYLAP
eukprot:COSAG01_NODE_21147_length_915_cov_41.658088_2_plen_25_part_01